MDDVLSRGYFTSPGFLSLIVYSYNNVNSFDKPMNYYFQEPYAAMMPELLDGSRNQGQVNSELPDSLHLYFQPSFLEGMKNRTETKMIDAFRANSVHDWQPENPLRLYHSSGDQYIPIADSEITADNMKKGGSDVEFVLIGDGTHGESSITMITLVVPWFESLRTDL
jgi:dipeptidyl aminopeptidase/acylaminoacyl peptidase